VESLRLFAPAKLNLFLAVTGLRPDGFHDLISVAAPLDFGDDLEIQTRDEPVYSLSCDNPEVPLDERNLVLKAAKLFSETTGCKTGAHFNLKKRVPLGAGLGGGSSDGTTALMGLNQLAGRPLERTALGKLAAELGSDCGLFLEDGPSLMRGRGERIEALSTSAASRIQGRKVLVFKPAFRIDTAWAYRELAAAPENYIPAWEADSRLEAWLNRDSAKVDELIHNNLERVAFKKFPALPILLNKLHQQFGLTCGMSGSGSACFAVLDGRSDLDTISRTIREAWGDSAFVVEAQLR
jgi:4-diphosphocytidyl-2-C-methyl-D-erythritol kinase